MLPSSIRIYVDTSVFGGIFDDEFSFASRLLFRQASEGRFRLVVSDLSRREIGPAPERVKSFFSQTVGSMEVADITEAALQLRRAYLAAGILSPKSLDDALHVALATVSECDAIVSWNFKHIVHFQKISLYNEVNVASGYGKIAIHSPLEVLAYDENEDF